jgi:metallo-beta-lactamase class B
LKDGNQRHIGAMWGGDFMRIVQEGIKMWPDMQTMDKGYIASSKRFKDIEDKAGVDVIVHPHAEYDGTFRKIEALRSRKSGDPHPFVVGKDDVARFATLHVECGEAQLAWAKGD